MRRHSGTDLCADRSKYRGLRRFVRSNRPQNILVTQKAGCHRDGGILPLFVPVYRSAYSRHREHLVKQKVPEPFSQRIGFGYELYGGELGTRTPDPLRVMHDNFSFFRTMIR